MATPLIRSKPVLTISDLSDALCEVCPPDEHLSGTEPIMIWNQDAMEWEKIQSMHWDAGRLFITTVCTEEP